VHTAYHYDTTVALLKLSRMYQRDIAVLTSAQYSNQFQYFRKSPDEDSEGMNGIISEQSIVTGDLDTGHHSSNIIHEL
jgi:hypothetical protein